jgi:ketosteroid isomerase-like protein
MTAADLPTDATQQRLAHLEKRVMLLESVEEIRALRCRYHELVNEDQGSKLYELFAPDASIVYGNRPPVHGRDNIRQFFATFPVKWARQFMHQHVVETDGVTGRGHCYLDGRPVKDGKSYHVVGRFDDEYVRVAGVWRFQRVVLTVHYMIEPSQGWSDLLPLQAAIESGP